MKNKNFLLAILLILALSICGLLAYEAETHSLGYLTIWLAEDVDAEKLEIFVASYEEYGLKLFGSLFRSLNLFGFTYESDLVDDHAAFVERLKEDPKVRNARIPERGGTIRNLNNELRIRDPRPELKNDENEEQLLNIQGMNASNNPWYFSTLGLEKSWSMLDIIPNKNDREISIAVLDYGFGTVINDDINCWINEKIWNFENVLTRTV
ncbi:MAG: hypothetical protein FWG98_05315 [Candidatus Cloacimonetes bacterium]|nr:hypothetical protein [Candidatus Cloacimonadota bacterium]